MDFNHPLLHELVETMSAQLPPWIEKLVDRAIQMLQNDTMKKKIQIMVLEPLFQNMLELIFPYVIMICVIFGLMIILMVSILALLVFRLTGSTPSVQGAG